MGNKADITARVGAVPPSDAPIESTSRVQADGGGIVVFDPQTRQPTGEVMLPAERAAQNEQELQPLKPQGPALSPKQAVALLQSMGLPPQAIMTLPPQSVPAPPPTAPASDVQQLVNDFFGEPDRPGVVVAGQGALIPEMNPEQGSIDQLVDTLPQLTDEDRLRMPAASMSESPAKGILPDLVPKPERDKFDGISRGGFSDVGEEQYNPLNGAEVWELILSKFDELVKQCPNDLRFSMALTYPRVRVRVRIEVEGAAEDKDGGFTIEKIIAPKAGQPGGTALEIARQRANQIVFVVEAMKQEFTEGGESDTPPDQIRDELGLSKPRKQIIHGQMPGQQWMVDVAHPGSDASALTR